MRKQNPSIDNDRAELIAAQALGYLAQNKELLVRFMGQTGTTIEILRQDAREPHVLASVLDHMMSDESLMLAFAANAGIAPEFVASAHARLNNSADTYRAT